MALTHGAGSLEGREWLIPEGLYYLPLLCVSLRCATRPTSALWEKVLGPSRLENGDVCCDDRPNNEDHVANNF